MIVKLEANQIIKNLRLKMMERVEKKQAVHEMIENFKQSIRRRILEEHSRQVKK